MERELEKIPRETMEAGARLSRDDDAVDAIHKEIQENEVLISIDRDGRFYVNHVAVKTTEMTELKDAIEKATHSNQELPVVIDADARAPHQAVITAMDAASRLGHVQMSFSTSQVAE